MSKSDGTGAGLIQLLDDPEMISRKFKRAVTDSGTEVRYDPQAQPGVSNLLEILGAATGQSPAELAKGYTQYGPLKSDAGEAVIELLTPIQVRYRELLDDPGELAGCCAREPTRRKRLPRRRSTGPTGRSASCPADAAALAVVTKLAPRPRDLVTKAC